MLCKKLSILLIAMLVGTVATQVRAAAPAAAPRTGLIASGKAKWATLTGSQEKKDTADKTIALAALAQTKLPAALFPLIAEYLLERETLIHHLLSKGTAQTILAIKGLNFDPSTTTVQVGLWYKDGTERSHQIYESLLGISPHDEFPQQLGTTWYNCPKESFVTDQKNYPRRFNNEHLDGDTFADIALNDSGTEVTVHVFRRDRTHAAVQAAFPPAIQAILPTPAAPSDLPTPAAAAAAHLSRGGMSHGT
jgi:hypothetical protein